MLVGGDRIRCGLRIEVRFHHASAVVDVRIAPVHPVDGPFHGDSDRRSLACNKRSFPGDASDNNQVGALFATCA